MNVWPQQKRWRAVIGVLGLGCGLLLLDYFCPPDLSRVEHVSGEVLDRHGAVLRPFLSQDGYWRLRTRVEDVSPRYVMLLKAYEDKRFDQHWGIDPLAVLRAARQGFEAGRIVSGASTLSMQVARLLDPAPRGWSAKLKQSVRALQLEWRYSKAEILSLYLTLAPFGGNLEGVRAASLAYFGKPPRQLTLSEAALLVALPQSPERLRPDRHALQARMARDKVLQRALALKLVRAEDVAEIATQPSAARRMMMPSLAPHLALNLAREQRGQKIVSTIDAQLQAQLEALVARDVRYQPDGAQIAVLVVENASHAVRAYIGGSDYWGAQGQVDLAGRARSPGSALKPFIYGLAFDDLILHPASQMRDEETRFGDYAPRNFDGGFLGDVSAAMALRLSLNMPAVSVLERLGPLRFARLLEDAGANLVFPHEEAVPSLPIALGGLGISLSDLTALYTGLANEGRAVTLRFRETDKVAVGRQMIGPVAAYYVRQVLRGVSLPEGWAMGQGFVRARAIGFKTGTSYGFRDGWALGFSRDYTVGVWVGRADGAPRAGEIGRESAAPVLLKIFEALPPDQSAEQVVPNGALLVEQMEQLPVALRQFRRSYPMVAAAREQVVAAPAISFPLHGATLPLVTAGAGLEPIPLQAKGGHAPLTWMVNGQMLGQFERFDLAHYRPDGEGVTRITVVDDRGRSDTSIIRFKKF